MRAVFSAPASAWTDPVWHLGVDRWWDAEEDSWRDGKGQIVCTAVAADDVLGTVRTTRVALPAAHRNHDTSNDRNANLSAIRQR
jgi:hypothetical protein